MNAKAVYQYMRCFIEGDKLNVINLYDFFSYKLSKHYGEITSIVKNGKEQLTERVKLTVMRAPIDNEIAMSKQWYAYSHGYRGGNAEGFDVMFNKCYSCTKEDNTITVQGSLCGVGRIPFLKYTVKYTFCQNGIVKVDLNGDVREDCVWLPRLGFEFNVSHYSAENLMKAMHTDELKKDGDTIIRIDYKNSGLGSHSCGNELLEKYRLGEKKIKDFEFYIVI